jgi:hypothetical protein
MEPLTLRLPAEARLALRRIARRDGRPEAEVARDLLLRAIDEEERERFFLELEASATPALRERLSRLAAAVETIRGGTP